MKLRSYETMFLLHPDLSSEERENTVKKYSEIIANHGGNVVLVDQWPLRKLAYKVQKQTHGYYVVMFYGAPGDTIQELTRNFRLDERVMKFMTNKLDDEFDAAEAAKKYAQNDGAGASAETEGKEE